MSNWINIEDQLPESGMDILFNAPGCYGVEKGHRFDDIFVSDRTSPYGDQIDFTVAEVDWWMPLPEPPSEVLA
jgi:Protein of unknown function (DUF551)